MIVSKKFNTPMKSILPKEQRIPNLTHESKYVRYFEKYTIQENNLLTARVFPDPVWAIPTMFLPLNAIGQLTAWIGVGLLNPCFLIKKY